MDIVTESFKVAAVEFNPHLFELEANIAAACTMIEEAASNGAKVIVLPEASMSGMDYPDREAYLPYLDTIPGKATVAIEKITRAHKCYVALGITEIEPETGATYNAGALVGPDGYVGKYRKTGLNFADVMSFKPGNAGYPNFPTEYGNLTMLICYDDTYWEPGRVASLKGAHLILHMVASGRGITNGPAKTVVDAVNHSTSAAVQEWCAWNGTALISADRNNSESSPQTGMTVVYGGSSSIWQADGTLTAMSAASDESVLPTHKGTILYGEIDPSLYDNPQRATFAQRRPELYIDLSFFRPPLDQLASIHSHDVSAHAVQYPFAAGDFDTNLERANTLAASVTQPASGTGLFVLPAFSLTGPPASADQASAWAEPDNGVTTQALSNLALRLDAHVVGSHIETDGTQLYHRVVLLAPNGQLVGSYRQTHLDESMASWATPGDELPVFSTSIGRIGLLTCADVRFPEAAGVLCVRRADIIAIPTSWDGSYGGPLHDAPGLFAHAYPDNTMIFWYSIAKNMQAYTVVANAVGGDLQGSSGIFTLNPVNADGPVVGSTDGTEVVSMDFATLGPQLSWINQDYLLTGRRTDLFVPLTLPVESKAFTTWRDSSGFPMTWAAYDQ
ncbi:MAG: nitrilase-related carbon-nitrogen hydrolase [Candidatus Nanopelagicales bacterium]